MHINHASRRHYVYIGFSLSWFHDFYAINNFEDCQVYLAQWDEPRPTARWDFYHYQPVREERGVVTYFGEDRYYYPWRDAQAIVLAEKAPSSSWSRSPVQFEYRSTTRTVQCDGKVQVVPMTIPADGGDPYVAAAMRFHRTKRPVLLSPGEKISLPDQYFHYSPETPYCGSLFPVTEHLSHVLARRAATG